MYAQRLHNLWYIDTAPVNLSPHLIIPLLPKPPTRMPIEPNFLTPPAKLMCTMKARHVLTPINFIDHRLAPGTLFTFPLNPFITSLSLPPTPNNL